MSDPGTSSLTSSTTIRDDTKRVVCLIGAGSFASVLVIGGRSYAAIKRVADASRSPELKKEYKTLQIVHKRCSGFDLFFSVPKPHSYHYHWHEFARVRRAAGLTLAATMHATCGFAKGSMLEAASFRKGMHTRLRHACIRAQGR